MEKKQSNEDLLKEAEWAERHIRDEDVPQPTQDEFEKIWERIQKKNDK